MTVELALCLAFMLVAYPLAKSIALHYLALVAFNVAALGVESADSSILAITFLMVTLVDVAIVLAGGRKVLWFSAAISMALCIESMLNMDVLLNHIDYINAAINAVIAISLIKGYGIWTHGK